VRRTLQEGVLSGMLIFPLDGSLAYLKLLWPHFDEELSLSDILWVRKLQRIRKDDREATGSIRHEDDNEDEPLRDRIRNELFVFVKAALNVEEYREYARGPVSTWRRFQVSVGQVSQ
jgi:hypothetical protein